MCPLKSKWSFYPECSRNATGGYFLALKTVFQTVAIVVSCAQLWNWPILTEQSNMLLHFLCFFYFQFTVCVTNLFNFGQISLYRCHKWKSKHTLDIKKQSLHVNFNDAPFYSNLKKVAHIFHCDLIHHYTVSPISPGIKPRGRCNNCLIRCHSLTFLYNYCSHLEGYFVMKMLINTVFKQLECPF